ncbi:MAG: redoxin domain-containing protein [Ignavibacteriaceae bacterium]
MLKYLFSLFVTLLFTAGLYAQAHIDKEAPGFTLTDSHGKEHSLSGFAGKYVVLEWINFECPFVKKHYEAGNMQKLQKEFTEKDVIWLSICSSAEGKQGNFENDEINERIADHGGNATAYLIDEEGTVGKLYGAKTTPHMFVINPDGILIYAGALDDKPSIKDKIEEAFNYVREVLLKSFMGDEAETKTTAPYGCGVKYKK